MLIIRRSNCINTTSGLVFSVSDRPVCARSLTENIIPEYNKDSHQCIVARHCLFHDASSVLYLIMVLSGLILYVRI